MQFDQVSAVLSTYIQTWQFHQPSGHCYHAVRVITLHPVMQFHHSTACHPIRSARKICSYQKIQNNQRTVAMPPRPLGAKNSLRQLKSLVCIQRCRPIETALRVIFHAPVSARGPLAEDTRQLLHSYQYSAEFATYYQLSAYCFVNCLYISLLLYFPQSTSFCRLAGILP